MKKIFAYCGILALTLLLHPATATATLDVQIAGDKLSLYADQVPLQRILQRMAEMGVIIRIDPQINPEISAAFEDREIGKGLASIFKFLNHVLIWEPVEAPPPGRLFRLAEIQVFNPGGKSHMRPLERRSTLSLAKGKNGALFVKDEILLMLRPGTDVSKFKTLLHQIRGTILKRNPITGVYRIRVPKGTDVQAIVERITKQGMAKAEPNYAYPITLPYSGGVSSVSEESALPLPDGKAPIAVLDTGLAPDSGLEEFVVASFDAMNPDQPISDALGHGTQMALIAAGLVDPLSAQEKEESRNPVIPIRAFDDNGFTSNFSIMQSMDFALKNGARVMSLSWSSETRSVFLENTVDYADSKGLVILAAAGNEPTGKQVWPAAYQSVIGVGALTPEGEPWKKSNYGSFVTLSAPGFARLPVGYKGDPGLYAGTSISTAFAANRIASYLSKHPQATKQDIFNALKDLF